MFEIENTLLVAAMRPETHSTTSVTSRFLRHFNLISIESFNNEEIRTIFQPIIDDHFGKSEFPQEQLSFTQVLNFNFEKFQIMNN